MNIIAKNTATSEKFSKTLEESLSRWNVQRVTVRDKIAETISTQGRLMLEADDDIDIGNPEELCNQLSKLRLKYTEIKIQEGEEQATIMLSYFNETNENMMCVGSSDKTKLGIYEKYIQTSMDQWTTNPAPIDCGPEVSHIKQCQSHMDGMCWQENIAHVINTEIREALRTLLSKEERADNAARTAAGFAAWKERHKQLERDKQLESHARDNKMAMAGISPTLSRMNMDRYNELSKKQGDGKRRRMSDKELDEMVEYLKPWGVSVITQLLFKTCLERGFSRLEAEEMCLYRLLTNFMDNFDEEGKATCGIEFNHFKYDAGVSYHT